MTANIIAEIGEFMSPQGQARIKLTLGEALPKFPSFAPHGSKKGTRHEASDNSKELRDKP